MTIIYDLTQKPLPTLPVPHDCIIRELRTEGEWLTFIFEPDITYHDGMCALFPGAKTIHIRYHLTWNECSWYRFKPGRKFPHRPDCYEAVDFQKVQQAQNIEYLYHTVGYCSMMVKLFSATGEILLDVSADRVEYILVE